MIRAARAAGRPTAEDEARNRAGLAVRLGMALPGASRSVAAPVRVALGKAFRLVVVAAVCATAVGQGGRAASRSPSTRRSRAEHKLPAPMTRPATTVGELARSSG